MRGGITAKKEVVVFMVSSLANGGPRLAAQYCSAHDVTAVFVAKNCTFANDVERPRRWKAGAPAEGLENCTVQYSQWSHPCVGAWPSRCTNLVPPAPQISIRTPLLVCTAPTAKDCPNSIIKAAANPNNHCTAGRLCVRLYLIAGNIEIDSHDFQVSRHLLYSYFSAIDHDQVPINMQ